MEQHTITALQHYYDKQEKTARECLLALKAIVLSVDENIVHIRKYQIPFFRYKEFNLGFLWVNKKKILLGFVVDKKAMPQENMKRQKDEVSTLEINPLADIPIELIKKKLSDLVEGYEKALRKS